MIRNVAKLKYLRRTVRNKKYVTTEFRLIFLFYCVRVRVCVCVRENCPVTRMENLIYEAFEKWKMFRIWER